MKAQVLSAISFLAITGAAAPGGCHDYSYDIPTCDHCPYPGHDFFGDSCYKECPKEYRQCKDYDYKDYDYNDYDYKDYDYKDYDYKDHDYKSHDYRDNYSGNNFRFELQYNQEIYCPKDYRYDLQVKVEACSSGDYHGKDCLNVYYSDGGNHKRSYISESNLGIYLQQQDYYNPREFNYNNYCHDDRCEVPTEYLPSYPDLCEKEIYLAVGNNRCYDDYSYDDYSEATKYIKVKVGCNRGGHDYRNEERSYSYCKQECCCYSS